MKRIIAIILLAMILSGVTAHAEEESGREATLSFSSFDGGGPEYSIAIDDPQILTYSYRSR